MNPDLPLGSLRQVTWDEVGPKVTVPGWRKSANEFGSAFKGVTVESIPDAMPKLPEIGSRIQDPKGLLLTPQQRTQRAGQLLAIGLGIAMIDGGWELHLQPGVFGFQRGAQEFNPFLAIDELMKGKLSRQAWVTRCQELGLSQLTLFPQSGGATAT